MQDFFADYGLWLLLALLIVILVVFLITGRKASDLPAAEPDAPPVVPVAPLATPVVAAPEIAPAPVIDVPVVEAPVAVPTSEPVIEPVAEPVPVEVTPVTPATAPAAPDAADDLLKLKGVGPKLNSLLGELGVTRYAQIAAWTEADIAAIDAKLGTFKGRPVRDQWVDQASYLAAGDLTGFEAKYGKI